MIEISGYKTLEIFHESENIIVYKAKRKSDELNVILKYLRHEYPTPEEINRFRQEYDILRSLKDLPGIIHAFGIEKYHNSFVIITEDFAAESLKVLMNEKLFELKDVLRIGIRISEVLGGIHAANVIHKGIQPSNLVYNPSTNQLKVIDFSKATSITREVPSIKNLTPMLDKLPYMSPEQTGRMNRAVDYRTDYYSLGVTLYELLSGKPPFESQDPLELIHCHIAKQAIPLLEIVKDIPEIISEIITKLLAKTAEERYQSAQGIKADLEQCLDQLQKKGAITTFKLCRQDITDKFTIPQKLYGREREVNDLLKAFERVSESDSSSIDINGEKSIKAGRSEMMLVAGYSGIGKTSLVNELHKVITKKRGYFISGKFDQFQRNIPYSAVVNSFSDLIRQLLTESEEKLLSWKEKLLNALKTNAQIIIDVIPELELVLGAQPEVAKLPPSEAQNRFNIWFQRFIKVFAEPSHPLVIFLDDLQWADAASLMLLETLMISLDKSLFIIGAYRDNEVHPAHPLMLSLEKIKEAGSIVNSLFLSHLELSHINQFISDTLNYASQRAQELASLVQVKTNGNPFFMGEFLKSLYTEKLLEFDSRLGSWQFDVTRIQAREITDNVVELMADKIQKLNNETQEVLKLAACIGNQFKLETLSIVYEHSLYGTLYALTDALKEGLVVETQNSYFKFSHDRIQQAAYSLIPDKRKRSVHWKVGQLLLENTTKETREQKIFDIVNQLNFCVDDIKENAKKIEIADLNLTASKRAKESAAYEASYRYLDIAIKILPKDSWDKNYELTLSLYIEAAEAAFLTGLFDEMNSLSSNVLINAKSLLDKVKVYEVKVQAFMAQNKPLDAVSTAREILKLLGVKFPKRLNKLKILLSFMRTKLILGNKKIEDFINLPIMRDPYKVAAMRLMSTVSAAAYFALPELYPLLVFKQVNLSVRYGNANSSAFAFAAYGSILCGVIGDIENGYKFGKLAIRLVRRLNARENECSTIFVANCLINHWKEHIKNQLQSFEDAYKIGLETGDTEFAALSAYLYCYSSFYIGKELPELDKEMLSYSEVIKRQLKQKTITYSQEIHRQTLLNLLGGAADSCKLIGDAYNEEEKLRVHEEANDKNALCHLFFNKLRLCYIFQDYKQALENAKLADRYLDGVTATETVPQFYFYDSLVRLAIYPFENKKQQKHLLKKIKSNLKQMKKWADFAQMNYLHKYKILMGEFMRISGEHDKAMELYDEAIKLAKEQNYIHEEGLANELAAKLSLIRSKIDTAKAYMQEARHCYLRWGAIALVRFLEERYHQFLGSVMNRTDDTHAKGVDAISVMRSSQAISGEIVLDRLLNNLMKIVIENAGAKKGFLILKDNDQLNIAAHVSADNPEKKIDSSYSIENSKELSVSIVNYVVRTSENVVINDAVSEGVFTRDEYIISNKVRSILCLPIIRSGDIIGLIYLENNEATNVFTPERVEVLNLLTSQAAISIENAMLYNSLEESEKKFRSLYENALEGIYQVSPDGILIDGNPSLYKILGIKDSQNNNNSISLWDFFENSQDKEVFLKNISTEKTVMGFENQFKRDDESIFWVSLTARSVTDKDGKVVCYEGSIVDITERLEKERAEREREAAQAANHSKSEFLASVSHEIRTPMNAIFGFTELLESQIKDNQQKQYLSAIASSGKTLLSLINDILDLSKIEAGRLELQYTNVELRSIFKEVKSIFTIKIEEKGLKFIVQIDPTIPEVLSLDEVRLRQILFNLVGNAVKFTDRGHIKLSVHQGTQRKETNKIDLIFSVQDTGLGIPPDQKEAIFEAFKQTKGQSQAKYGGTGLGLAITKRLVEMMGGKIFVESEMGKGSSFNLSIKDVLVVSDVSDKKSITSEIDETTIRFKESVVLIVDDLESNRTLLASFLKNTGLDIVEAENGKVGVELARQYNVNLILMDLRMPVMDGFEATEIIKNDDKLKTVPVIAVSASAMKEHKQKSFDSGCNSFLSKPVKQKTLIHELMKYLPYYTEDSDEIDKDEKKSAKSNELIELSSKAMEKLPELLELLEGKIQDNWNNVKNTFIIDDIEKFALKIKEIGQQYETSILIEWGSLLYEHSQNFDIAKLPAALDNFPTILNQLKGLIEQ